MRPSDGARSVLMDIRPLPNRMSSATIPAKVSRNNITADAQNTGFRA